MVYITLDELQVKRFKKQLKYFNFRVVISPTMLIYTNCRLFIAAFDDFRAVPTYIAYNIYSYHGKYIRPFLNALVFTT